MSKVTGSRALNQKRQNELQEKQIQLAQESRFVEIRTIALEKALKISDKADEAVSIGEQFYNFLIGKK